MTYRAHARAVAVLGLPLIGGHVAQFAINMTDTIMLGWYGVDELAAVTLAGSCFFVFFMLGAGFAFAVMPLVAAAAGAGEERQIRRSTRMGLWLSLAYGVLAMPVLWYSEPLLLMLGQKPGVAADASAYLRIAGWGLFPALLVMVLKSYLAALERTQVVLWVTVLAALVNAVVNYALIFGHWGAPELGITGAAIASVLTQLVSLVAVLAYALKALAEHELMRNFHRPDWEMLREVFRLGVPIGLTNLSEISLFTASAMMMGWLGTATLAAHGIAITLSGLTFMVHLGLSNAATIRSGNAYGRRDWPHMARGAKVVIALSLAMSVATIILFLTAPDPLISLFLGSEDPDKPQILLIGAGLLAAAALFQLMDGMQVVVLGLLRGVQDTGVPMVIAALSYWVVGIPASYLFGFTFGWGGVGVWYGLALGLSCAGFFLLIRFWRQAAHRVPAAAI
ncbi:MATE family efflux transporter [Phaeobacter gallaeciensis]|uniref:MATE family efflux transporter n=1 Tax=Phaeobacter gallaeciensis TaxID=60890 RepID=UPI00237EF0BD|nr:MATE family efflux transporter [Phaeobacter gallaeciensis]MDE4191186.1 MATE family efflux transporter [Phaeobacter gallaeciensis]MDE4199651.1 MATE family efflux transporter [Phaeobacter gallaeciensis]MDE4203799.1 MATE family efflux transporter [Phaeobacter gallaeciensis]MDE4207941.1 MATE family efflux transporter [Phaeobacter gallaeciensis]MDE4216308.1 MATE family efflux transporter [Phaeobacter gallaeciensis]